MTPYALTTEQRTTPLGLDVARPRLSWKLRSEERGAAQSAYQIVAAAQAGDLDVPERRLWDSGKVESSSGLLIEWDGPELAPSTRYHWRVLVWDQAGEPATPADSWFETGLLRPEAGRLRAGLCGSGGTR